MKNILCDANGVFSWRKFLTAQSGALFATAVLWHLIKHNGDELPASYMIVIGGVFAFYFAKTAIENIGKPKAPEQ